MTAETDTRPVPAREVERDVDVTVLPARTRGQLSLLVLSICLVVVGAALLGGSVFAPDFVARAAGSVKVEIDRQVHRILTPDELPVIRLGPEGSLIELDLCDGTFTEMVSYRMDGVPPLYAAHNNCGGDILLGWEIGERVRIEGSDTVYTVVEERHTPKWSHIEKLVGISGEIVLQTCYYGENRMRFLGLAPE